jgi:Fe-S oxidoreductase
MGAIWPGMNNFFMNNPVVSGLVKRSLGFAAKRSIPLLQKQTLNRWMRQYVKNMQGNHTPNGKVYLFNDEFTNFNDTDIGIKTIRLLVHLGYEVLVPGHLESGRTYLSKGLVRKAKKIANRNMEALKNIVSDDTPLIGVEPSAILVFRDEYPDLALDENKEISGRLAKNALMIDEFLEREIKNGKITKEQFSTEKRFVLLHGHCQQKALTSTDPTKFILSFPENYEVEEIPSGCCGMAGSFGFEKEHYDISMKIGELILFPAVRKADEDTIIAAPGTSCRHQIKDGTSRKAMHPVEILFDALK